MPGDFGSFLTFIGSGVFIGFVLSIVAENVALFQKLSSGWKIAVLGAIAIALALVSHLAVTYIPAGIVTAAEPYYQVVVNAVVILLASKAYHAVAGKDTDSTPPGTKG